jgi:hypothetical protein
MTKPHPITPPLELAQKCWDELRNQTQPLDSATGWDKAIALAYQAGADQELEACCEWFSADVVSEVIDVVSALRAARRPKPSSLKEQALLQLDTLNADLTMHGKGCDLSQIRRALEALPDNTSQSS